MLEDRALARRAVDKDEAAGLLDDAVHGRQAEPGAGAELLGREERLEDAFEVFLRDADPGIGDLDQHVIAGRHDFGAAPQRRRLRHIGGADRQRSAARHRVARVDGKVDDDLFELPLIDLGETEIAAVDELQLDILADQAAQQVRQLDQHVADIEHARLQRLLAREGQQLPHEIGGAVAVLLDLHDVGEGRVARPEPHQQQVAEPDHRGQQVVEIMRDAAGELADRLHLLRLRELHFEVLLLGDVDEMQHQPRYRPSAASRRRRAGSGKRRSCARAVRSAAHRPAAPASRPSAAALSRAASSRRSSSATKPISVSPISA